MTKRVHTAMRIRTFLLARSYDISTNYGSSCLATFFSSLSRFTASNRVIVFLSNFILNDGHKRFRAGAKRAATAHSMGKSKLKIGGARVE